METRYASFVTRLRCPECGAALLSCGSELWCSRQGSAETPGCQYGVTTTITVRAHLNRVNKQYVQEQMLVEKNNS